MSEPLMPCLETVWNNTNWRAGGLEAVLPNKKSELSAGCTEDRRAGQRAAQKGGPAGCGKRQGELQ